MKRLLPLLILAALPAWSDDGRIPIWEPGTVIDAPGSYYLTRDLQVDSGTGIVIMADDVEVDLNGRMITGTGGAGTGIPSALSGADVVIRNGRLSGLAVGVDSSADPSWLRIRAVEITSTSDWPIHSPNTEYVEWSIAFSSIRPSLFESSASRARCGVAW